MKTRKTNSSMFWFILSGFVILALTITPLQVAGATSTGSQLADPLDAQSTSGPEPGPGVNRGEVLRPEATPVLLNVPAFLWKDGCGPTAAGMLLAYWDGNGYGNLMPGDASTQTAAVDTRISSTGSYNDYALPLDDIAFDPQPIPDKSEPPVGDEHADDSIADLMNTSQSYSDNYYGWSWYSDMALALQNYVPHFAPEYSAVVQNLALGYGGFTWDLFKAEINAGRPVILLVDTDADGETDHFVPAIGYDETGYMYAVHDTWDTGVHWYNFAAMASGQSWGIYAATLFQLKPLQATLNSPTGAQGENYNPTYQWNKVSSAEWYRLYVSGPSGAVVDQWVQASVACGASTCSATPTTTLGGGNHTWYVLTYNSAGYGPWSTGMNFSTTIPTAPGVAVPTNPTGYIGTDYWPDFVWGVPLSGTAPSWYRLYVSGPSGAVLDQWYQASSICVGGTCTVTSPVTLGGGNHTWYVLTYNSAGFGPWTGGTSFSTYILQPPGAATLNTPSGAIGEDYNPTYQWNKVDTAEWYRLYVAGPSGAVVDEWHQASVACGVSTCSATPGTTLGGGNHTWYVLTWNSAGFGPWSIPGKSFSTTIPTVPAKPVLQSPSTTSSTRFPTFTWNVAEAVVGKSETAASWYRLYVYGPSGAVIDQWYQASAVCGVSTCSVTPNVALYDGNHTWYIDAWNQVGYSEWSNPMNFTVAGPGFSSQFNGSATNWTSYWGSWSIYANVYYQVYGDDNYYVSSAYTGANYADFDFQTRVYTTSPDYPYIIVRGTPTPLDSWKDWNSGYYFGFDTNGYYQVGKMVNGTWYDLQPWTYTPYWVRGGWNDLRVVAIGSSLYYLINGNLVWSGTDASFSSGRIGYNLGTWSYYGLWADWAMVSSFENMPLITETISPEQQALNNAAITDGSTKSPEWDLNSK
jgi:hypothetical protein